MISKTLKKFLIYIGLLRAPRPRSIGHLIDPATMVYLRDWVKRPKAWDELRSLPPSDGRVIRIYGGKDDTKTTRS